MGENKTKVTRYVFDDLILDIQQGRVLRNDEEIYLPKLSYDLLVSLVESSPALLSQQVLMEKVWPDRVIGDETLKQRIKLLRKSLGDDASAPRYIEAIRGRGYRLRPKVKCECVINQAPAAIVDLTANDHFPNITYQQLTGIWRRISKLGLSLIVGLSLATLLYSHLYSGPQQDTGRLTAGATAPADMLTSKEIANDYYLKGKEYYQRYRELDNSIAIEFFQKALGKDPEFSPAYAGLSQAYSQQLFQFNGEESDRIKAIDNAYQAIAFDNNSADAYKALGIAYYVSGWLSKSINAHLKALSLAPDNLETISNLGFIYSEQGKLAQAINWHKKALAIEPGHVVTMVHAGQTLSQLGHQQLAQAWFRKAIDQQPDYLLASYHLGQAQLRSGQYQKAIDTYQGALKRYQHHALLSEGLADSYFYNGQTGLAHKIYRDIIHRQENKVLPRVRLMFLLTAPEPATDDIADLAESLKSSLYEGSDKAGLSYHLALIYARQQQEQQAIRYLVQAVEQGLTQVSKVEQHPLFQSLKTSDSFKRLLARMKLKQNQENQLSSELAFFQTKSEAVPLG
ncbi:winged helix-turn-helix domain-containing protein [Thalassomonas viridans]|uniref:Winged helix-turn-helix domain-containing protein n=1 Tax=Thalassomonas viridans TaxID=137584 RepID=A0AAE9Z271_9GAMM|nr:tetratricopeptide repeat protein [Thalassomonas viridans]WDE05451.1 winged helix-turn-helix domain-containing protein [Thalassomonas viridans]